MIDVGLVVLILLSAANLALTYKLLGRSHETADSPPAAPPPALPAQTEAPEEPFAVARRERRPSWRERRRELEAKHRTERKKLEEWRD